jgi:hypothetical protein
MFIMYQRIKLLKLLQKFSRHFSLGLGFNEVIQSTILQISKQTIVFFCKSNDLVVMNKAVLYARDNEQSRLLTFVHIDEDEEEEVISNKHSVAEIGEKEGGIPTPVSSAQAGAADYQLFRPSVDSDAVQIPRSPKEKFDYKQFHENVALLDNMYPKIRLNSLVVQGGKFDYAMIAYMSKVLDIPENYMFIASPNQIDLKNLGAVRVVTH